MALSPRQEHMLRFIRDFSERHGYPPTIREIGKEVGISSTSVVNYNLDKLEKEGLLERDRTISRGLKVSGNDGNRAPVMVEALTRDNRFRVPLVGSIVASKPAPPAEDAFSHSEGERRADARHRARAGWLVRATCQGQLDD